MQDLDILIKEKRRVEAINHIKYSSTIDCLTMNISELNKELNRYVVMIAELVEHNSMCVRLENSSYWSHQNDKSVESFFTALKKIKSESLLKFKFKIFLDFQNLHLFQKLLTELCNQKKMNEQNVENISKYCDNRLLAYYPKQVISFRLMNCDESIEEIDRFQYQYLDENKFPHLKNK